MTFGNVFEIHTNLLTCSKFYSTSLKVFWGLPLNIKIDTCGYKTARQEAAHKKKRGNINVIESKHSWPGPTFGRAEGSQARRLSHNAGKDYEPVRYTCGVSYLYKGPIKIGKLGVKEAYLLIGGPHCTPFINDCQCWPTIVGRFHSWKQKKHDFLVLLLGETWGDWFPNFVVWCFRCTAPTSLKTAPISFKTPFPSKKND